MSIPQPFEVHKGEVWRKRQRELRERILADLGLSPLPEQAPLSPHYSQPISLSGCTVTKVAYQLWPGVFSRGLLYRPKVLCERPAPAILCCHGHWEKGYAHVDVQKRCVMLATLGYMTFISPQDHEEDINRGYSYQTYMVWNNMRALDFLQSLPEVDGGRIGVCGASGGGTQTQMLLALDTRVCAASIVGATCDYRELLFPHRAHCHCNHFPNVMKYTDMPEISALGFPTPIQYLTMDDWTQRFSEENFPAIQRLYSENGYPERVECVYWPTEHVYDRPKRERTYQWMERWLRNNDQYVSEPEDLEIVLPEQRLLDLVVDVPEERTFRSFTAGQAPQRKQPIRDLRQWEAYRAAMLEVLAGLLGLSAELNPAASGPRDLCIAPWAEGLREDFLLPAEDEIVIPVTRIAPADVPARSGLRILLSPQGCAVLEEEHTREDVLGWLREGTTVVLPELRFSGTLSVESLVGHIGPESASFRTVWVFEPQTEREKLLEDLGNAWIRNGIIWGRPVLGMMVTDLWAVLQHCAGALPAVAGPVTVVTRGGPWLAAAALFAACLDARIASVEADFVDACFSTGLDSNYDPRRLPPVPNILRHGDLPHWAALLADRRLLLRRFAAADSDVDWLRGVFELQGNAENLVIEEPRLL